MSDALAARRRRRLLRDLQPLEPLSAVRARWRGRELVLFSTNDYLGLSGHPAVREAAAREAKERGMGPRGSALVCGYTEAHEALEEELAALKGSAAALLFPTGWAANTAVLGALAGPDVALFSDQLNHASIIDGCRLAVHSGAALEVYRHGDCEDLEMRLQACSRPRKLIVSDSLFSMDGDLAPLPELVRLKREHGALLVLDEAHATLVLGERGGGWAEACGVAAEVDLQVGTLSKAFGAVGGFVATTREMRRWLLNAGRPYVFSTAPALPMVAAAREALAVRRREPQLVGRLFGHLERLTGATGLAAETPVLPLVLGSEESALQAAERLRGAGLLVPAIRPPTVPRGTARLRVTVSAAHTGAEVDLLARELVAVAERAGGVPA